MRDKYDETYSNTLTQHTHTKARRRRFAAMMLRMMAIVCSAFIVPRVYRLPKYKSVCVYYTYMYIFTTRMRNIYYATTYTLVHMYIYVHIYVDAYLQTDRRISLADKATKICGPCLLALACVLSAASVRKCMIPWLSYIIIRKGAYERA